MTLQDRPFIQKLLEEFILKIETDQVLDPAQLSRLKKCLLEEKKMDSEDIKKALFTEDNL